MLGQKMRLERDARTRYSMNGEAVAKGRQLSFGGELRTFGVSGIGKIFLVKSGIKMTSENGGEIRFQP